LVGPDRQNGARRFETRHVGQIGKSGRRLERGDKVAQVVAITVQNFRTRRMRSDERMRRRAEEILTDDPLGRRKFRAKRID
jgi:hypothetical protein